MVVLAKLLCIRYWIQKLCSDCGNIVKNGMEEMTSFADKRAVLKPGLADPAREARRRRMEIRRLKVIAHAGTCSEILGKRSRSEGSILSAVASDDIGVFDGDVNTAHLPGTPEGAFVADAMSPLKTFPEKKEGFGTDSEGERVSGSIAVVVDDDDDKGNRTVECVSSSCASLQKSLSTRVCSSVLGGRTHCDDDDDDDDITGFSSVKPQITVGPVPSSSEGSGLALGGNGGRGIGLGGETGGLAGFGRGSHFASENRLLPWGYASICGRRKEMEDAVVAVPRYLCVPSETVGESQNSSENSPLHFFGVYDGHGGAQVANFCKNSLHRALIEELEVVMNDERFGRGGVGVRSHWQEQWQKALVGCFNKVDAEVSGEVFKRKGYGEEDTQECCPHPVAPETVGSTAVVAIVGSCQIIVANCGDSRAVLSRDGKAIALSVDHKPEREDELERIEAAGGRVIQWNGYRVFGVLAMSRAIGDRYLKPYVISDPEITFTQRRDEDECLILASDGLWDVLSNEEVCEVARRYLARRRNRNASLSSKSRGEEMDPSVQAVADHLSMLAIQRGSPDNISVLVVDLLARKNA